MSSYIWPNRFFQMIGSGIFQYMTVYFDPKLVEQKQHKLLGVVRLHWMTPMEDDLKNEDDTQNPNHVQNQHSPQNDKNGFSLLISIQVCLPSKDVFHPCKSLKFYTQSEDAAGVCMRVFSYHAYARTGTCVCTNAFVLIVRTSDRIYARAYELASCSLRITARFLNILNESANFYLKTYLLKSY